MYDRGGVDDDIEREYEYVVRAVLVRSASSSLSSSLILSFVLFVEVERFLALNDRP